MDCSRLVSKHLTVVLPEKQETFRFMKKKIDLKECRTSKLKALTYWCYASTGNLKKPAKTDRKIGALSIQDAKGKFPNQPQAS